MVTPRHTTQQTLVCSSRTGVSSAFVPRATALLESPSRSGMMERFSSKETLDDMIRMTTYLPKAPMCMPTSPPVGTARTTTATTSGLLATATVLAVWPTLTPRTFRVSFQIYIVFTIVIVTLTLLQITSRLSSGFSSRLTAKSPTRRTILASGLALLLSRQNADFNPPHLWILSTVLAHMMDLKLVALAHPKF